MDLALRGAGADRAPGDQVRDVLGADGLKELGGGGQAEGGDLAQEARAARRPAAMSWLPSSRGSLIRPFQPTVVRGFSK